MIRLNVSSLFTATFVPVVLVPVALVLGGMGLSGCGATSLGKELNWHRQQRQILLDEKNETERRLNVSAGEQESLRGARVQVGQCPGGDPGSARSSSTV